MPTVARTLATAGINEGFKASNLFDVSNYSAVVTGGGTGIGLMITESLVANGAKVYITGRREEALKTVVEKYSAGSGKIIALPGDITQKDEILRLVKEVESQEPQGIHLLVNNAGIARDDNTKYSNGAPDFESAQSISEHLWKSDPAAWASTFETNVIAQFFVSAGFLPLLAKSATSSFTPSIINIASISGVMKGSSNGQFAYAASKAAFLHLMRMQATTFLKAKVRVNCIAPGMFPSEMTTGESDENQKSSIEREAGTPAGRFGEDKDMAACALFLAGPAGTFLNGQVIYPDGACT
ncbi:Rhamnolipids biosynthesis 3-oxoacyl-[acyl-carrier-protein] reductase [Lachnellula occidentalis]|uniref:Rhamnolipids biosynthesis 3-oxoacyl-[acyl-carrier-protein] reductase n=1 Tax=Lachnellula occidentalis TaxID=215460 RepID=A0A8H8S661_9HELO|nr:Rhamnolipids biosynthesis 3-oxoacyl-[acyl-carrier-protein] reductase [Lachnellula occidentalis]